MNCIAVPICCLVSGLNSFVHLHELFVHFVVYSTSLSRLWLPGPDDQRSDVSRRQDSRVRSRPRHCDETLPRTPEGENLFESTSPSHHPGNFVARTLAATGAFTPSLTSAFQTANLPAQWFRFIQHVTFVAVGCSERDWLDFCFFSITFN